jgi:transposase InsO family protein
VARLMRIAGLQGVHRRRWRHHQPGTAVWEDRVQRRFHADRPNRLWFNDITQHRTAQGLVYCAAVLDVYSRRIVGWSIADHLRTELVVDALQVACWRRRPIGTVVHSDRGAQYTSWLFGSRLRAAGRLGSMGKVARLRQFRRRVVRRLDADQAIRPPHLVHPDRAGHRDLRIHRGVLQPDPPTLRTGLPVPNRL